MVRLKRLPYHVGTRGSASILVGLVILIVAVIGAGLYTRLHQVMSDVARQQNVVAARLLADSGFELVQDQAARGALKTRDTLTLASGLVGYAFGAEQQDPDNRRFRDGVVYGLCEKSRRVVQFRLVFDAPDVGGGPATPGRVAVEMLTDISTADVGPLPPQDPSVLLSRARTAAKAVAP